MTRSRWALMLVIAVLILAFFAWDLGRYFDLTYIKSQQLAFASYFNSNPVVAALAFFLIYVAVTGLSLPGAAVMTLAGGAVFGLLWGTLLVSLASTIGATLAFLASRFLLRDLVQKRFGDSLRAVNRGIERDGALYLFTLRLVPVFPFFAVNLLMGLTPIRLWTYAWISQLGMLPGTIVYVNAGTQLAQIDSLAGLLSPPLIAAFVLLAVFPFLAKWAARSIRRRAALRGYVRPRTFDRNLIVIGAGSAGLVSAYIAAAVRAKVTLVEKHKMGGECLNTGCVPSKALIRSAHYVAQLRHAENFGVRALAPQVDFAAVMARVQRVINTVAPHDSIERYTALGVDCVTGDARVVSPWEVEVNGRRLTARHIILATGSRPRVPTLPGIEHIDYATSDDIWEWRELPKRLLVLGGGPVACELAQSFARLGANVVLVHRGARLLKREDAEFSSLVTDSLRADGVDVRLDHEFVECRRGAAANMLVCRHNGASVSIEFDRMLLALGRESNTEGVGVQALRIGTKTDGTLDVDEYLQTSIPTIYACGDVAGPYQFTHVAAHQAWYATVNALFGGVRRFKVDYSVIPWCTFTEPEVARVGLNEQDAIAKNIPYEVTTFGIDDLDRAITDDEAHGLIKVLTPPGKDRILGVTIAGARAGDIIAEFIFAMRHGLGLGKILRTIHPYPTFAEANKYVAGAWRRNHVSSRVLGLLEWYHRRRRG